MEIFRVFPRKNFKSNYVHGETIRIQVVISTEDNSTFYLHEIQFSCKFIDNNGNIIDSSPTCVYNNKNTYVLTVFTADLPTNLLSIKYQYLITTLSDDLEHIILPLLSDYFEVLPNFSSTSCIVPIPMINNSTQTLLSCYRMIILDKSFPSAQNTIYIREEYGSTMGSHIWDAGYILATYLTNNQSSLLQGNTIELGAGCGVVGLCIAAAAKQAGNNDINVLLTDQVYLISTLEYNIQYNKLTSYCKAMKLEWTNKEDIDIVQCHFGEKIDYILAADVLYNVDIIVPFLLLIQTLSYSGHTIIYLAQKLRGKTDIDQYILKFPKLFWECVFENYHVLVWKVTFNEFNSL